LSGQQFIAQLLTDRTINGTQNISYTFYTHHSLICILFRKSNKCQIKPVP